MSQKGLEDKIREYAQDYYSGFSSVSDEVFDNLVEELKSNYPNSELLKVPGWGFMPEGNKVNHLYGLYIGGLSKVHSINELNSRMRESSRVSYKLDGLSVVSYFVNGRFVRGVTRGNGKVGKDVTGHLIKICKFTNLLNGLDGLPFTGAIRGEIELSKKNFEEFYDTGEDSCNARNVASGLLNRNELSNADASNLSYIVYKVLNSQSHQFKTIDEIDDFLYQCNFQWSNAYSAGHQETSSSILESDETVLSYYKSTSREISFDLDGLVLTIYEGQDENGNLNYEEVAYKFKAPSKTVKVTNITWSLTRTGRLVPRIWFDPVELSGASVQKCTGHNAKYLKDNNIGPGTLIEVMRSGEVIPYCVRVVNGSEGTFELPEGFDHMYWSGADLRIDTDELLAYRFFSVIGEEEGAGYSLYTKILDLFYLSGVESLCQFGTYSNEFCESILSQGISGTKTLELAKKIVNKVKRDPVDPITFLVACNIHGLSWKNAKKIIQEYPEFINDVSSEHIDFKLISDKLSSVNGIGSKTVSDLTSIPVLSKIRSLSSVVNIKEAEISESKDKVKVAITGKLSVKRSEFEEFLRDHGYEVSSISKETKYLITDNPLSGSSKNLKADKLGICKITEKDFRDLVNS